MATPYKTSARRTGIIAAVSMLLASSLLAAAQTPTCANPPTGTKPTLGFMLNKGAYLAGLQAVTASTDNPVGTQPNSGTFLANHFFNRSASILFTNTPSSNPVPSGWVSRGGLKDDSYADLTTNQATIGANTHLSVIIYDNEEWAGGDPNATPPTGTPDTPPHDEQHTPAATTASFVGWAHNHFSTRYTAMSTPGRDLASLQSDYANSYGLDDYYLNTDPPYTGTGTNRPFANWGSAADIFEIQAQAHTADGSYISFTTSAAQQAVAHRPSIQLFAGISTVYGTDSQMCDAVVGTYQLTGMTGYWLNFSGSPTPTEYLQAVNFLNRLYNGGF